MTPASEEKPLPEAIEIESLLIGGILNGSISYPAVSSQLTLKDFTLLKHQRIMAQMQEIHDAGSMIDIGTLAQRLLDREQIFATGSIGYLLKFRDSIGAVESSVADGWCRILRGKTTRRRLIELSDRVRSLAWTGTGDMDELLALSQKSLSEITEGQYFETGLQLPADVIDEYGSPQDFLQPQMGNVIPTPFVELNWKLGGGYREGEVVIIAARPSQGKSARAMQQAVYSAFQGIHTAVYPLEMKVRQLLLRAIASRAGVDSMLLRRPQDATPAQRQRAVQALNELYALPHLRISREAELTMGRVEADLRRCKSQGERIRLCIIDHLGLVTGMGRFENRVQEISGITRAAKRIAMQLNVCMVLLCQLNRSNETQNRRPVLSDLRDSGSIEQDADIVEFLHWHEREKERGFVVRTIENIIAKQREGPLDTVKLGFHVEYCDFRHIAQEVEEVA